MLTHETILPFIQSLSSIVAALLGQRTTDAEVRTKFIGSTVLHGVNVEGHPSKQ
jgi:hypothetical protein